MIANYEPYFNKIRKFHQGVYEELLGESFVVKETQMFILQCNFKEYVENDHVCWILLMMKILNIVLKT